MAVGDPYITRAQFKSVLDISSDEENWWIDQCLAGASRAIEKRSGWPTFWNTGTPVERPIPLLGKVVPVNRSGFSYTKILLRDGIAKADGFAVSGWSSASLDESAWDEGEPVDSIILPGGSSLGSTGFIGVTAVWGWPQIPSDVLWAAQMQAHRLYRRKGSPEGIAGSAEWGLTRIPALDPDVLSVLKGGGYMRAGIG